jgi:hypothetical protein
VTYRCGDRARATRRRKCLQVIQAGGAAEQASRYGQVVVRHACIERNKRCAVAYHHERWRRVRQLRWQHGSVLPAEVRTAMSAHEMTMFQGCVRKFTNTNKYQFRYNTALATYMRSLGGGIGLDITLDQQPPTAQLNVNVLCVTVCARRNAYVCAHLSHRTTVNCKHATDTYSICVRTQRTHCAASTPSR